MAEMMEFFKQTGAKGGKARAKNLSKSELSAIGKKAAAARWSKKAAAKRKAAKKGK